MTVLEGHPPFTHPRKTKKAYSYVAKKVDDGEGGARVNLALRRFSKGGLFPSVIPTEHAGKVKLKCIKLEVKN